MIVTTKSGAKYIINNNICTKIDHYGMEYPPFIILKMYGLPKDIRYYSEAFTADKNFPVTVGHRLYVSGIDNWWISTEVISIEDEHE